MMPFTDSQLDSLARSRDIASRLRAEKKTWLDACYNKINSLRGQYGPRIDWLSQEGDSLYRQMSHAFERSKSCFSARDHAGAGQWAAEGRQIKARLQEVNAEKRHLIDIIKVAQAEFTVVGDDYRRLKAEHEQIKQRFHERLTYLQEQSAKERTKAQVKREQSVKQRQRDREERERERQRAKQRHHDEIRKKFGDGTVGGNPNWTSPVYATMASDGRAVTISFGRGNRVGQTLIADGHIGMNEFYKRGTVGHDHYLKDGRIASKEDRKRFR